MYVWSGTVAVLANLLAIALAISAILLAVLAIKLIWLIVPSVWFDQCFCWVLWCELISLVNSVSECLFICYFVILRLCKL